MRMLSCYHVHVVIRLCNPAESIFIYYKCVLSLYCHASFAALSSTIIQLFNNGQ